MQVFNLVRTFIMRMFKYAITDLNYRYKTFFLSKINPRMGN